MWWTVVTPFEFPSASSHQKTYSATEGGAVIVVSDSDLGRIIMSTSMLSNRVYAHLVVLDAVIVSLWVRQSRDFSKSPPP